MILFSVLLTIDQDVGVLTYPHIHADIENHNSLSLAYYCDNNSASKCVTLVTKLGSITYYYHYCCITLFFPFQLFFCFFLVSIAVY